MTSTETATWGSGDRVVVDPQWLEEMRAAGLLNGTSTGDVEGVLGVVTGMTDTGAPQVTFQNGRARRIPNHALMEAPVDEGGEATTDSAVAEVIVAEVARYAARVRGALNSAGSARGYAVSLAEVRRQGTQGLRDAVSLDTLVGLVNAIDAVGDGSLSVQVAEVLSVNNLRG